MNLKDLECLVILLALGSDLDLKTLAMHVLLGHSGQGIDGCRMPELEGNVDGELLLGNGCVAVAAAQSGALISGGASR